MKNKEIVVPITFVFIALFLFYGIVQIKAATIGGTRFGPSFFPTLCTSLLLVCSVLELWNVWKKGRAANAASGENGASEENGAKISPRLLSLFCLAFAFPVFLWAVGFIPTGLVGGFVFCLFIRIPWRKGLCLSAGMTVALYLLFNVALKVQLPRGLFF